MSGSFVPSNELIIDALLRRRCAYLGNQSIVSSHDDGGVHLWDQSGTHVASLVGHTHAALCVDVSPDGTQVATGGEEGVMRIWDTEVTSTRCIHRAAFVRLIEGVCDLL